MTAVDGNRPVLRCRCFGTFEAFVDGAPLACRSMRALELLAYLVDRRGSRCSVRDIATALWEGRPYTRSLQSDLRNLVSELSRSLAAAGCGDVLVRQHGVLGLDARRVSCDYWDYVERKPGAEGLFFGEYMSQYSWAEGTLANLTMYSMR